MHVDVAAQAQPGSLDDFDPQSGSRLERLVFNHRAVVLALCALVTVLLGMLAATKLTLNASFEKMIPRGHPYIRAYLEHRDDLRGLGNSLRIVVENARGDVFEPAYVDALKKIHDEVFLTPGVDRAWVKSLWAPAVRWTEVTEEGFRGGPVMPDNYDGSAGATEQLRANIARSGLVGSLVGTDFKSSMLVVPLLDKDPTTGQRIDYRALSHSIEQLRAKHEAGGAIRVHAIGFAKLVGDLIDGLVQVGLYFGLAAAIAGAIIWLYTRCVRSTALVIACSLVAVVWQLGIVAALGFELDPYSILVPFLVFAIGVSHGVQKISAIGDAALDGADSNEAARRTFRQLFMPAIVALLADLVGFVTILAIPVEVIREMAITASLGIGVVILTDLVLLPVLVSFLKFDAKYAARIRVRSFKMEANVAPLWESLSTIATRRNGAIVIGIAIAIGVLGFVKGRETPIGDTTEGVPELRPDSRYNLDTEAITRRFSIGTDIINVIVETPQDGCVNYEVMRAIDEFAWAMANVEGVRDVLSLPGVSKVVSAGWSEGNLKWRNLPRNEQSLVQAQGYIETSTGLLNKDCTVIPVTLFLADHRAETIERVVAAVKDYRTANVTEGVKFRLATGNVGVMAAQNEEVRAKELPILAYLFAAIAVMCILTFRSFMGTLVVMIPLALVSILVYAVMAVVGIGLKITTLPMVALGAGIGVDYGIYLFSRMQEYLRRGVPVRESYMRTLRVTGTSIVVTGITLAVGVVTWVFSPLKFQADIGLMLTFMFLVNMFAAILLIPALAAWLVKPSPVPAEHAPAK